MRDDKSTFTQSGSPASRIVKPDEARHGQSQAVQANQNNKKHYLISRNVTIHGHRTSIRLEPEMWTAFSDICRREGVNIHELTGRIAEKIPPRQSLSSAVRVFLMAYFKASSTEEGHAKAGHPSHKVGF